MADVLAPGEGVERYVVERKLGAGGMSEVYLVRHQALGTLHALKVLTLTGPSLHDRLMGEGRVQATIHHPNLVRVSDVLDVKGLPALVMEYVDGPDLGQWIRLTRPDPEAAERVFRPIVAAVAATHAAGVIHRDLKPGNVFLTTGPDGTLVPKVGDFGLMKATAASEPGHTRAGTPMGTPQYMAPEQIRDAATVDARADVWSLGAILYELLAHEIAFGGRDLLEVFTKVSDGDRAPLPDRVPPRLAAVVDWCLALDAAERPADCATLLRALDGDLPPAWRPRPPASASLRVTPVAALALVGSLATLLALTVGVVLFVATRPGGGALLSSPAAPDCADGFAAGWVELPGVFEKPAGSVWTLRRPTPLYAAVPTGSSPGRAACLLPANAQVVVPEGKVRGESAYWLKVGPSAVTLAPTVAASEPEGEVAADRCIAHQGELVGWFRFQKGPLQRMPEKTFDLVHARYVYAEPPPPDAPLGPPVCALPAGARVDKRRESVREKPNVWWVALEGGAWR